MPKFFYEFPAGVDYADVVCVAVPRRAIALVAAAFDWLNDSSVWKTASDYQQAAQLAARLTKDLLDEGLCDMPPIGSIIAWHKDLPGVPALNERWLECNGQVVNDSDSPLDGQTLPDLNTTGRFLRGAAASGGQQGYATALPTNPFTTDLTGEHTHTTEGIGPGGAVQGGAVLMPIPAVTGPAGTHSHTINGGGDNETRPANMGVVWVMRVK